MRARAATVAIFCTVLLVSSAGAAAGLDLGLQAWAGNLGFREDRKATDATFPGADYYWGLSLYGTQAITDTVSFETGLYSDPILRNISYTLFDYNAKILRVGFGPFFGFFNDATTLLKSGISTSIRIEIPGALFVSFRSDSSIGGELVLVGDYLQQRNDISLGFYVPNAICTLSLNSRTFSQKTDAAKVIDSLTEYAFSTNIYQKNVPYQLIVSFAYQSLAKTFVAATTTASTLNSVVIGAEVDVSLGTSVTLTAGLEGTVYSFGVGTLVGSTQSFLFRSFAGAKVSVDSIPFLSQLL